MNPVCTHPAPGRSSRRRESNLGNYLKTDDGRSKKRGEEVEVSRRPYWLWTRLRASRNGSLQADSDPFMCGPNTFETFDVVPRSRYASMVKMGPAKVRLAFSPAL
ncbi:vacuolar protein sorting 55 (VPS55) family protein [Striga asiatica]|uniref:Vacuolar protein sorting 55 (VPS55) family protein n=1 Tax=Striga asiatica TaxID=4170 RepID=A0A5A7PZS6_STRAF|nr:vacuolar protein sorting 55 (VPS55) family protein [Striga asiatica]